MTDEDVSNAEIQMDLYRMMRSGTYVGKHGARDLLHDIQLAYPRVPKERIEQNVRELINRLNK